MPGEAHVYFTAFSSGRKALVMFCVLPYYRVYIDSGHTQRDVEIERTQDGKQWSRRHFLAHYLPSILLRSRF